MGLAWSSEPKTEHKSFYDLSCKCIDGECKCGDAAKQESKEMIGQVKDNWAEAEKRARAAADEPGGCTVADCPGGLPSNAGKDEDSQESKEYDKAIDDWKEGEARIKAADPNEAYPYGLPPAQQQRLVARPRASRRL